MKKRISLVLVDDSPLAGEGIVALMRAQPGFQILAGSAELEAALRKVRRRRPDLVLLNLRRRGDDGLMLAGALHGDLPESQVIVVGLEPPRQDVASFVRAGVSGFLMADASFDTLLRSIHSVAHGIRVLPSELTHALFGQLAGYGVRRRPERAAHAGRRSGSSRLQVAAWSLESRPFELDHSPLV